MVVFVGLMLWVRLGSRDTATLGTWDGMSEVSTDGVEVGVVLGTSLGDNGTWDPPPQTQQADRTFFPLCHLSARVSQN